MTYLGTLIGAHAILATFGFVGLIAPNLGLLALYRQSPPAAIPAAIRTWRFSARIFGPVLGLGILLGLWLATQLGISLASGGSYRRTD